MRHPLKFTLLLAVLTTLAGCFRSNNTTASDPITHEGQTFKFSGVEDLYRFLTYAETRIPLVSAHRGGPAPGYPENAIETFQRVADKMPAIIECDIALDRKSTRLNSSHVKIS